MRAILTWHSVDPSGSAISVDEGTFRAQVRWLAGGIVRIVPLRDLLTQPDGDDVVALTFDDGFANFATVAWPLLRERGWPVTLFVVSDHVGGTNAWGGRQSPGIPELPLLDWDALGRLGADGVTLGAHTRTHPDLTACPDTRLDDELAGSREAVCAHTGGQPDSFAYPYGAVNARVAAATARYFARAVTTQLRPLGAADAPALLPRLDTWYLRDPATRPRWGSPAFRRWLAFRAGLRRVRSVLTAASRSA